MSDDFSIDDIDRAIVEQLRINGRATNQQIANSLSLTAATVSARIRRMEEADKLRVVAVSDFSAHGYNVLMEVAIEVDGRPAAEVVEELTAFPEVFAAHLVTGRYDIDMLVVLREFDDLVGSYPRKVLEGSRCPIDRSGHCGRRDQVQVRRGADRSSGGCMIAAQLDDLDRQLIDVLARDARVSNRKIAVDLGVTEGTVRGRIKRLQQEGLISFTAITSFGLADSARMAFIGVQTEFSDVREIGRRIAELSSVNAVMITMGRFNILAICLFNTLDNLHEVASNQILAIPGVHHVETSIAVKTVKYNARVVRITEADAAEADGDGDF